MAINPSIAMGVQPMQLPDPMNRLAQIMQIRGMQDEQSLRALQTQEYQRGIAENNALNEAYRGALGSDGAVDRNMLFRTLAERNLGSKIPGVQKQFAEFDKAGADLKRAQVETLKNELEMGLKKTEHMGSMLSIATPENWGTVRGIIKAQLGADLPEQFDPQYIQASIAGGQTLTQRLAAEHQRLTLAETGRHNRASEANTVRGQDLTAETARRGQNMVDARSREGNEIQRQAARTQVINDPVQGPMLVDKGTGGARPVTMGGVPVQGEQAAKAKAGAQKTLPIIDQAEALIDQATGSYFGAGVDLLGRAVGQSTGGADAIAKLKVLEGQLMMAQPRMEGPQSNLDVQLYRQMAGQIGDPTVPADMKKAALSTIKDLQTKYAGGQQAPAAPKPAQGVARVSNDAEFNALPSGTVFVGPDGKQRRKP